MPTRVRRATAADTDALITLLDQGRHEIGIDAHINLRSPEYRANFAHWCRETATVQVWLTTDRAGAMVLLNHRTVQYIAVATNRHREGIGRKLLTHAQKLCEQLDAETLSTNICSQRPAFQGLFRIRFARPIHRRNPGRRVPAIFLSSTKVTSRAWM